MLVDDDGNPVGTAEKATVHGARTPRHLAFSCYGFDGEGRLLVTRRARDKVTFPGVRTNTCCGHPAPDEPLRTTAEPWKAMATAVSVAPCGGSNGIIPGIALSAEATNAPLRTSHSE